MARRVVFRGKHRAELEPYDLPPMQANQARFRTLVSAVSTGTEMIAFNRDFAPGSHWDKYVGNPFHPGYSAIGELEEVGSEIKGFKRGDIVATRISHRSHALLEQDRLHAVPAGIDRKVASCFALAKIAGVGCKRAQYTLGDSVLIIGAGPIGQLSTRWARASGAESIIVADSLPERLKFATMGGATHTIARPVAESLDEISAANHGRRPRVVIDSTGHAGAFAAALQAVADRGRVVVLGDTGYPGEQRLSSDVISRGLTITAAHDGHADVLDDRVGTRLFFQFVADGRFNMNNFITHTFRPEACAELYGKLNTDRAGTMGIVYDWTMN